MRLIDHLCGIDRSSCSGCQSVKIVKMAGDVDPHAIAQRGLIVPRRTTRLSVKCANKLDCRFGLPTIVLLKRSVKCQVNSRVRVTAGGERSRSMPDDPSTWSSTSGDRSCDVRHPAAVTISEVLLSRRCQGSAECNNPMSVVRSAAPDRRPFESSRKQSGMIFIGGVPSNRTVVNIPELREF